MDSGDVAASRLLTAIRISRASSIPIYHQIKEQILEAISSGLLKEGDPLPSERDLVEHLSVSRMTLRRALSELALTGQLHTQPGKGTYVQKPKLEQKLVHLAGFSADMTRAGHRVDSRVLNQSVEPASERLATALHIAPAELVFQLERVRRVDGVPTSWERVNVPARLCQGIEHIDFASGSLYDVLRRQYRLNLRWAQQTLEAAPANWDEQQLLEIPEGAPVLHGARTTYTDNDVVVEYSTSSFRGDRYRYEITLIGNQLE